jgi:hypothetical protein
MKLETWIEDCRKQYREQGEKEKNRLFGFYEDAYKLRESDPERALTILHQGIEWAELVEEPWWRLFYEKLELDGQVHFQRDFRDTLDRAARHAVEVRNPRFAGFPGRWSVEDTLLAVYLGIDAEGYAEAIREILDAQEREIPQKPCVDRYMNLARRRTFLMLNGEWEEAQQVSETEREVLAEEKYKKTAQHFLTFTYAALCEIAYRRKNWVHLAEFVDKGHEAARKAGHQCELAEIEMWRAVEARYAGQEEVARRTLRDAASRLEPLQMPPSQGYFAALFAYYELNDEALEMLQVCDEELASIVDRGRLLQECRLRIERCRLLVKLHRSLEDDLDLAREAAMRVRFPEKYLKIIGRIVHGD